MKTEHWNYICGYQKDQLSIANKFFLALRSKTKSKKLTRNSSFFLDFCLVMSEDGGTTNKNKASRVAEAMQHVSMQFVLERHDQLVNLLSDKDFSIQEDRGTSHTLLMVVFNNWYLNKRREQQTQYARAVSASLSIFNNDEEFSVAIDDEHIHSLETIMTNKQMMTLAYEYLMSASEDDNAIVLHELGVHDISLPERRYSLPSGTVGNDKYHKLRKTLLSTLSKVIEERINILC